MATRRNGKPYIYATWVAKLAGGDRCVWSAWFKAHFTYSEFEEEAADLVAWNRDHNDMMRRRRAELEREGFVVAAEEENKFKVELPTAFIAGKPDLIARRPGLALLVDGKTGRERDSDLWQVMLYLRVVTRYRRDLIRVAPTDPDDPNIRVEGEVQYNRGDARITVTPEELTPDRVALINTLIKTISADTPPLKVPSSHECHRCNIGPGDCPQRIREQASAVAAAEF